MLILSLRRRRSSGSWVSRSTRESRLRQSPSPTAPKAAPSASNGSDPSVCINRSADRGSKTCTYDR